MPSDPASKLLVLPNDRSPDAFICTLSHPRTNAASRYFVDPLKGIYEFSRVAAPRKACRSWLLNSRSAKGTKEPLKTQPQGEPVANIISKPDLLIATPIDPLFLLLSVLSRSSTESKNARNLFLSCDDILDKLCDKSNHVRHALRCNAIRSLFESRLGAICDEVEAGDEKMYRMNESKLLRVLISKAEEREPTGFPASLENRFVKSVLEIPILGVKREESSISEAQASPSGTPSSDAASTVDSQRSSDSSLSLTSQDTEMTIPDAAKPITDEELHRLLRIRTLLTYIFSSYIPSPLVESLESRMKTEDIHIDFQPLEDRLAYISRLRAEAHAARSLGDFSRKRNAYEDDEVAENRAEKKRKKEEEERKKKLETRGIKNLKKVDITGMKKMSDFFGKGGKVKK